MTPLLPLLASAEVHPGWLVPFALLLLCIAVLPLAAGHWWEHNKSKGIVAAILGAPVLWWILDHDPGHLGHVGQEYVSFIVLLGSLFTVAGGIFVDGDLRATPKTNTLFLALGGVIASVVGTTGASMLLIRPVLRTNSERKHVVHTVVFFIFIVSNCGGLLTPLGDPPLFLGYLRGVPFWWTLHLWIEWAIALAVLLSVYFVWDTMAVKKETPEALRMDRENLAPLKIHGGMNFLFLAGVVAAAALTPEKLWFVRDGAMVFCAMLSLKFTSRELRTKNGFSWGPIVEVAVLFAGIFITMVPALQYLAQNGSKLGVDSDREFFWATGALSSFLDNAPTYLTFASVAVSNLSAQYPGVELSADKLSTLLPHPVGSMPNAVGEGYLTAISVGAVFMGANTYIGNGPNFMVKAIADSSGVKMPSFFGYMLYSVGILIPIFLVLTFVIF